MINAATPLINAAAIDVPFIVIYGSVKLMQLRVESMRAPILTVEQIPIPGAAISM